MYTTLADLKKAEACTEGYSKLLSFFGASKEAKTRRIPLHAIVLIGGRDDAKWALENQLTIDPAEFDAMFERTSFDMWRFLLKENGIWNQASRILEKLGSKDLNSLGEIDLVTVVACQLVDYNDVLAFTQSVRYRMMSTALGYVLFWEGWQRPRKYLEYLLDNLIDDDIHFQGLPDQKGHRPYVTVFEQFDSAHNRKLTYDERVAFILAAGNDPFDFVFDGFTRKIKGLTFKIEKDGSKKIEVSSNNSELAFIIAKAFLMKRLPQEDDGNMRPVAHRSSRRINTDLNSDLVEPMITAENTVNVRARVSGDRFPWDVPSLQVVPAFTTKAVSVTSDAPSTIVAVDTVPPAHVGYLNGNGVDHSATESRA